jgi:hypothetical protein
VGAPCRDAIECQQTNFCNLGIDAGSGTCAALRSDGGACGDFGAQDPNSYQVQQPCSYRGVGNTGSSCEVLDYDGGVFLPANQWFCRPDRDAGDNCYWDTDCKGGVCPDNGTCGGTTYLTDQSFCDSLTIIDAGGGG